MSDPLVSTGWLAERLGPGDVAGSGEVQVVDASWYMPGDVNTGAASYAAGHIPGAVFFDIDAIADHSTGLPHMLPTPDAFAQAAGALGLRRDGPIVVYDVHGIFSAPRVWWTLRTMGFAEVFVLDGGLKAWVAEGRALQTGAAPVTTTQPASGFQPALVRDLAAVRDSLKTSTAQIVDARSAGRFRGETPEPRAGLRSGHMPGALNLPFDQVVAANGTLKDAASLRTVFEAAGVDLTRPIVTTCGSGVTASVLALALARLGRDDVAVYDGSWSEWGGRDDTDIVTGP